MPMTQREHQLIMEMFKQETLIYAGLIECLKSREVVLSGDLEAFDELVHRNEPLRALLEKNIEERYRGFAEVLGVTGLPEP